MLLPTRSAHLYLHTLKHALLDLLVPHDMSFDHTKRDFEIERLQRPPHPQHDVWRQRDLVGDGPDEGEAGGAWLAIFVIERRLTQWGGRY